MKASQAASDLIKSSEDRAGFLAGRCTRLKAYRCPAGVWTIGWGHTRGVVEGMEITPERADELLAEDIAIEECALNPILRVPVSQGQFDALVSLGFNLAGGARAIPRKAPKLWKALHTGDAAAAAREFLDIDKAGERRLAGLTSRRRAEAELFAA